MGFCGELEKNKGVNVRAKEDVMPPNEALGGVGEGEPPLGEGVGVEESVFIEVELPGRSVGVREKKAV